MKKLQIVNAAKDVIHLRRREAIENSEKVLANLRSHDDWSACERKLKAAQVQVVLYKKDEAQKAVDKYSQQRKMLMEKYGVTEEYLQPHYHCAKCEDTGFVDGATCECLRQVACEMFAKESGANSKHTFENSCETDKHNVAVAKKLKEICENQTYKNVLLTGGIGTGKTFLLEACTNACTANFQRAVMTTAYNLNSQFLNAHLSRYAEKQAFWDDLLDVDVLVIDDLGTETVYRNVTAEYLFALLNERIVNGKQTFISTNLSLADIRDRYDERIFSRLIDQKLTFVAKVEGPDKRLKK